MLAKSGAVFAFSAFPEGNDLKCGNYSGRNVDPIIIGLIIIGSIEWMMHFGLYVRFGLH
jgi:hypothetical protein